jgi:hypothetical protein
LRKRASESANKIGGLRMAAAVVSEEIGDFSRDIVRDAFKAASRQREGVLR